MLLGHTVIFSLESDSDNKGCFSGTENIDENPLITTQGLFLNRLPALGDSHPGPVFFWSLSLFCGDVH